MHMGVFGEGGGWRDKAWSDPDSNYIEFVKRIIWMGLGTTRYDGLE